MNEQQQITKVPAFEQGVAVATGLFTAGPIGALAGWGAIRALKGKWIPWIVLGFPAVVSINVVNLVGLSMIGSMIPTETNNNPVVERPVDRPVDRPDRPTTLPHFNDPIVEGDTTLQDKCGVLIEAYNTEDRVGIFNTTQDIREGHNLPGGMTAPEACNAVGM